MKLRASKKVLCCRLSIYMLAPCTSVHSETTDVSARTVSHKSAMKLLPHGAQHCDLQSRSRRASSPEVQSVVGEL